MRVTKKFKIISLHITLAVASFCLLLLILFEGVLPKITRHQEEIGVPNVKGMNINACKSYLEKQLLRFQINEETAYLPQYPPGTVINQHPPAGARVKRNRTIYLTINTDQVPMVDMPNLVDGSIRHAYLLLAEKKLVCDTIRYIPDLAQGAVLAQHHQGKSIAPGEKIPQGAAIQLIVGAGPDKALAKVPDVRNKTIEAATLLLLDAGLGLPITRYESINRQQLAETKDEQSGVPYDMVIRQIPSMGSAVALGTPVELWVQKKEAEN